MVLKKLYFALALTQVIFAILFGIKGYWSDIAWCIFATVIFALLGFGILKWRGDK